MLYSRANPQNHQMDVVEFLVAAGLLLDEVHFKMGSDLIAAGTAWRPCWRSQVPASTNSRSRTPG